MNKLIVFTAPSGAGKTTIVRHLLSVYDQLDFSVSATTRKKRSHEKDGKDYYFLSHETFKSWTENGSFIEWEEVYEDQFYGTLRSEVERLWADGKCIVFDIDVKGALSIKEEFPEQTLVIFVKPPSLQVLIDRLKKRKTETEKSLKKRISRVKKELTYENRFDTVLVNDILEVTLTEAEFIVEDFLGIEKK